MSAIPNPHLSRRRLMASTLALGASTCLASGARAARLQTLRYSDHEPLGGMRTRFIKDVFLPAVDAETDGRLSIEDHWNGELAISYDALPAVSAAEPLADMAVVVPEYFARNLPLHQLFKSFPIGPTGAAQVAFFRRVYEEIPAFTEELARSHVVPAFLATGYPVAFFSTKPLNSLADLRGGRWRIASFWHRAFLTNAGATPVSMPWGEGIYEALRAGAIDGLMVNVDSGYDLKLHEMAPHVLVSKDMWLGHLYIVAMNKTVWDGLGAADQAAVQRAAARSYGRLGDAMQAGFDGQLRTLSDAGATVRELSREDAMGWARTSDFEAVQQAWVDQQKEAVGQDFSPVLQQLRAIMQTAQG